MPWQLIAANAGNLYLCIQAAEMPWQLIAANAGFAGIVLVLVLRWGFRLYQRQTDMLNDVIRRQHDAIVNHIDHSTRAQSRLAGSIDALATVIQRLLERHDN